MTQPDPFEAEIVEAFESGKLKSVASKAELSRLKAAARATAIDESRADILPSAHDGKAHPAAD